MNENHNDNDNDNHGDNGDNDQVTAITIDNGKRSKRLLTVIPGLERFLFLPFSIENINI